MAPVPPGCSTRSRAAPSKRSSTGSLTATRPGGRSWTWSRWTASPASRPPPPKSSPTRQRSWIPSTSCGWPAMRWTGAAAGVQLAIHGHRGMKNDPLYSARRTLHTGAGLLTDKQASRLTGLFADDAHVEVEVTWGIYQRMIAAYRHEDRRRGRELMVKLIDTISTGVPNALVEVTTLGRTLKKRAADVLAYFDRPGTSNGPTEAINGRLEHLRGSALGFRNLTNYIARSLLETGGFRPQLRPRS